MGSVWACARGRRQQEALHPLPRRPVPAHPPLTSVTCGAPAMMPSLPGASSWLGGMAMRFVGLRQAQGAHEGEGMAPRATLALAAVGPAQAGGAQGRTRRQGR